MRNPFASNKTTEIIIICKAKDCGEQATHIWKGANDARFCDRHFPVFKKIIERDLYRQGIEVMDWAVDEQTGEDRPVANWSLNNNRKK
jgi:hypothetical protein